MKVTMVTHFDRDSVVYTVRTAGDDALVDGDREVWRKEVPFGWGLRFRAGGSAFVDAAREQEEVAAAYARMP